MTNETAIGIHKGLDFTFQYGYVTIARLYISLVDGNNNVIKEGEAIVKEEDLDNVEDKMIETLASKAEENKSDFKVEHRDFAVTALRYIGEQGDTSRIIVFKSESALSQREYEQALVSKSIDVVLEDLFK